MKKHAARQLALPLPRIRHPAAAFAASPPAQAERLRDAALDDDRSPGRSRGPDHRGRAAAGGHRGRGARRATGRCAKLNALGFRMSMSSRSRCRSGCAARSAPRSSRPSRSRMAVTALGNSGATPGATASRPRSSASTASPRWRPRQRRQPCAARSSSSPTPWRRPRTGRATAQFGAPRRWTAPSIAARKGAAAIVIRSIGTDHHRNPHTGVQQLGRGRQADPGRRAVDPRRRAARSACSSVGKPVTDAADADPAQDRRPASRAMSSPRCRAAIPTAGVDRRSAAISTAGTSAPARSTMPPASRSPPPPPSGSCDAGKPRRTIRVVWFGAEEVGVFGGSAYFETPPE